MAMLTLAQAIDDAGSADPDRIQTALRYLRIPADATIMPWGVKFDTDGDNTKARVQLQTVEIAPRPIDPTDRQAASKFFGP
jgi:ABC-type branched-subunit amino acid transport system substrate-binding protein